MQEVLLIKIWMSGLFSLPWKSWVFYFFAVCLSDIYCSKAGMSPKQQMPIVRRMTTGIFFKCYQKRSGASLKELQLEKNPRITDLFSSEMLVIYGHWCFCCYCHDCHSLWDSGATFLHGILQMSTAFLSKSLFAFSFWDSSDFTILSEIYLVMRTLPSF